MLRGLQVLKGYESEANVLLRYDIRRRRQSVIEKEIFQLANTEVVPGDTDLLAGDLSQKRRKRCAALDPGPQTCKRFVNGVKYFCKVSYRKGKFPKGKVK